MQLFIPPANLLPYDGEALYYGPIMSLSKARYYESRLMDSIAWKNDEAYFFGKHIITKRMVAWYADQPYFYTYSNSTKQALSWTAELLELKSLVEAITQSTFNACLLNLYHSGAEGMAWHSDDEKTLGKDSAIASLSFGAERKFSFKHKESKESLSLLLAEGSLLLMKGTTQSHWLHALPRIKQVTRPRINLTFRSMIG